MDTRGTLLHPSSLLSRNSTCACPNSTSALRPSQLPPHGNISSFHAVDSTRHNNPNNCDGRIRVNSVTLRYFQLKGRLRFFLFKLLHCLRAANRGLSLHNLVSASDYITDTDFLYTTFPLHQCRATENQKAKNLWCRR